MCVQPRALNRLGQLPVAKRVDPIAEGLALLAEHVATLRRDARRLARNDRVRGFTVVAAQAEEEAAKALILLDLVRMGWQDQAKASIQVQRFYNHLVRRIYVEMAEMNPATFGEVRSIVDSMRPSLYLDGPNDVDWIYRNQILATREESLYVDYVHDEDGDRWVTPAAYDEMHFGHDLPVLDLIVAMHRMGLFARESLDVVSDAWSGVVLETDTHWVTVQARNRQILEALDARGRVPPEATPQDAGRVLDRWTFPLGTLELEERRVTVDDLQEMRERSLASLGSDWL